MNSRKNRIKLSSSDKLVKIIAYTIIILFAAACLYPLLMVLGVSFSDNSDVV